MLRSAVLKQQGLRLSRLQFTTDNSYPLFLFQIQTLLAYWNCLFSIVVILYHSTVT